VVGYVVQIGGGCEQFAAIVLACFFEVLICFDDLAVAFDPDFEDRAPGMLPIRGSLASTSSHARSVADSKSGASTLGQFLSRSQVCRS